MSSLFGIGGGGNVGASGSFYDYSIDQALRLDDTSGAKLTIASASPTATNRKKVAISCWVKRSFLGAGTYSVFHGGVSGLMMQFGPTGADEIYLYQSPWQIYKDALLIRDVGGWYHFALILDSTQATDSNRAKLYINGQLEDFSTWQVGSGANRYPTLNVDFNWHTGTAMRIGSTGGSDDLAGYIADFISVDGQDVSISDFGEDKNGIWTPKDVSGLTLGNAGFYLDFADSSNIGNDAGANNIDFTPANLAASDVVPDSPTNNFATLNPLHTVAAPTLSEGNLKLVGSGLDYDRSYATFGLTSGKWYAEFRYLSGDNRGMFGVVREDSTSTDASNVYIGSQANQYGLDFRARAYSNSTELFDTTDFSTGDIGLLCFDIDNGKLWFGRRDVSGSTTIWYDSSGANNGDPSAGTNPTYTGTFTGHTWFIGCHDFNGTNIHTNFGADGSFSGGITSGGLSDANGIGDFNYIESGFLALCTANLPEPAIGPNSDTTSDQHFNTVLYTGNASTNAITGVNFAPDWVWLKARSFGSGHALFDVVRGALNYIPSQDTTAESSLSGSLTSFDSDGFTLGSNNGVNRSGTTFASWNWKAGGTAVSNTDGSITSSVSANQDAGFSIVSYEGTGSNATVGHGLSAAPELIMIKERDNANGFAVSIKGDATDFLRLDTTAARSDDAAVFNDTAPTSTVFSIGTAAIVNRDSMIAYCFHSVDGFSKVGSYVGNGSADGTFVALNFRPAFLILRRTDSGNNWHMFDNKRDTFNVVDANLYPNLANAEATGTAVDFLSNGFKIRSSAAAFNASGGSYIYLAFAEAPFKYANAR